MQMKLIDDKQGKLEEALIQAQALKIKIEEKYDKDLKEFNRLFSKK